MSESMKNVFKFLLFNARTVVFDLQLEEILFIGRKFDDDPVAGEFQGIGQ